MNRILGVDFSGAKDYVKRIWLTELGLHEHGFEYKWSKPLANLGTEANYSNLVNYISNFQGSIGIDAPLSIPGLSRADYSSWMNDFMHAMPSAETFRSALKEKWNGKELKRTVEKEVGAPFSVVNLRFYRQADAMFRYVIPDVILRKCTNLSPFFGSESALNTLYEVCPSAFLKANYGKLFSPYKGNGAVEAENRKGLLLNLMDSYQLKLNKEQQIAFIQNKGGDAIDSLISALIVIPDQRRCRGNEKEGFIFY